MRTSKPRLELRVWSWTMHSTRWRPTDRSFTARPTSSTRWRGRSSSPTRRAASGLKNASREPTIVLLLVDLAGRSFGIELKYLRAAMRAEVDGELFILRTGAHDH